MRVGYTWVSDESWGWIPYHHGRWTRKGDLGWVWVPAASPVFKPGDVYWLYNSKLAGWGPLAPAEDWQPSAAPEQFLNVNTTYASFHQDARTIDPAGFKDRPKEPLGVAVFALALPSPAFPASRLEATRPLLRVGATRLNPVVPGTTFPDNAATPVTFPRPRRRRCRRLWSPTPHRMRRRMCLQARRRIPGPPGPPMQVIYPVPVYTGIVVLNPPEHPDYSRRNPNSQGSKKAPAPGRNGACTSESSCRRNAAARHVQDDAAPACGTPRQCVEARPAHRPHRRQLRRQRRRQCPTHHRA